MIERYNYNDEPSGRTETLVQALDRCERLEKQLLEIKNAYIDLTTQDEYGSYYIEEAKDFIDIVGRILKETSLLQELGK